MKLLSGLVIVLIALAIAEALPTSRRCREARSGDPSDASRSKRTSRLGKHRCVPTTPPPLEDPNYDPLPDLGLSPVDLEPPPLGPTPNDYETPNQEAPIPL